MGKRKGHFQPKKNAIDKMRSAVASSDDEDQLEARLESLLDDEIDQYNAFKDKSLLDKGRKGKSKGAHAGGEDSDEEEVYGLNMSSDDDEGGDGLGSDTNMKDTSGEEDDSDDDDVLGENDPEDGIPDSRAWGKKSRIYHDTDYVDQDFGGFEGSDAEMADQEEAEAKEIQKRMTAELDESDFLSLVPVVASAKPKKSENDMEILKVDFENLTSSEKRNLIERECPEVVHLLDERKEKLAEAKVLKKEMETQTSGILKDFYSTKYHAIMNYCINVSYYLYLRATNPSGCKGHPVLKRILQFRRLLEELKTCQQKYLVKFSEQGKTYPSSASGKPKRKRNETREASSDNLVENSADLPASPSAENSGDEEAQVLEKRGINYKIAKNKGLTPYRKKELRNPRVKHRMKFKKATTRRKGQVRNPRTETRKYDGELTGIKMNVTKSIKLG